MATPSNKVGEFAVHYRTLLSVSVSKPQWPGPGDQAAHSKWDDSRKQARVYCRQVHCSAGTRCFLHSIYTLILKHLSYLSLTPSVHAQTYYACMPIRLQHEVLQMFPWRWRFWRSKSDTYRRHIDESGNHVALGVERRKHFRHDRCTLF